MQPRRVNVPTHLLVEPIWTIDLKLVELRLSKRQLLWFLGALGLSLWLTVGALRLELAWWPALAAPAAMAALAGAFARVDGLPLDRWLAVWAAYHAGRPRRATWRPEAPALPAPAPAGWARYRPARGARLRAGDGRAA